MNKHNKLDKEKLLYFDDIHVGLQFISNCCQLEAEQMKQFARQFDPQPFHLDEKLAKDTLFGRLVASGWFTAAITMRLLVETVGSRFASGLIGKSGEISWSYPVYPEDELQVKSEVLELRPSHSRPDWGMVKIKSQTLNQQQQVVQILIAELMIKREVSV